MKIGCKILMTVFLFPLLVFAGEDFPQKNPQITPEVLAVAGMQQWLTILDAGKYAEGWEAASEYLKNGIPKDAFIEPLQRVRAPLGAVKSRSLTSAHYTAGIPGAPEGEYVVIQFKTDFENKTNAIETLVSKKEKDGQWKAGEYHIK